MTRKLIIRLLTICTVVALTIVLGHMQPSNARNGLCGTDRTCQRNVRTARQSCNHVWVEIHADGTSEVMADDCSVVSTRIGSAIHTQGGTK